MAREAQEKQQDQFGPATQVAFLKNWSELRAAREEAGTIKGRGFLAKGKRQSELGSFKN